MEEKEGRLPVMKERLKKLQGGESVTDFAKKLGLSRQTAGFYLNGDRIPDSETLMQICRSSRVSADWLLGLSADPHPVPAAADELGLSPKAMQYLRTLHELSKETPYDARISLLTYLLENPQFDLLLALCVKYVGLMGITTDPSFEGSSDYLSCVDTLKEHGFVVSLPDDQANALFSERIINLLRAILDAKAEHTGG